MAERFRFRPTNSVKGVFYFGALGPPIGGALFALTFFLTPSAVSAAKEQGISELLSALGVVVLMFSAWSYLIGFLPAVVTGALAGLIREKLSHWRYCFLVGLFGLVASTLPFMLVTSSDSQESESFLLSLAFCGLASGTLVARIFAIRCGSTNSLKRTDQSLRD